MRNRVYAAQVTHGRMSQAKADQEIAAMKAILQALELLQEQALSQ